MQELKELQELIASKELQLAALTTSEKSFSHPVWHLKFQDPKAVQEGIRLIKKGITSELKSLKKQKLIAFFKEELEYNNPFKVFGLYHNKIIPYYLFAEYCNTLNLAIDQPINSEEIEQGLSKWSNEQLQCVLIATLARNLNQRHIDFAWVALTATLITERPNPIVANIEKELFLR